MKCQYFHLESDKVDEVREICKSGTYLVLDQDSIPLVIPEKLKEKCPVAASFTMLIMRGGQPIPMMNFGKWLTQVE